MFLCVYVLLYFFSITAGSVYKSSAPKPAQGHASQVIFLKLMIENKGQNATLKDNQD